MAIKNKVHFYQYYTEEEYDKLVSIGDRDWPDIVPSLSNITGVITPVQTDGKLASLDENGFIPIPDVLLNQSTGPTDAASLADSVEITKDDITHPAIAYYMTCRSTGLFDVVPLKP